MIFASKACALPGFVGLEARPHGLDESSGEPSFVLSSSSGNLRRNAEGQLLGDQLFCAYPATNFDTAKLPSWHPTPFRPGLLRRLPAALPARPLPSVHRRRPNRRPNTAHRPRPLPRRHRREEAGRQPSKEAAGTQRMESHRRQPACRPGNLRTGDPATPPTCPAFGSRPSDRTNARLPLAGPPRLKNPTSTALVGAGGRRTRELLRVKHRSLQVHRVAIEMVNPITGGAA